MIVKIIGVIIMIFSILSLIGCYLAKDKQKIGKEAKRLSAVLLIISLVMTFYNFGSTGNKSKVGIETAPNSEYSKEVDKEVSDMDSLTLKQQQENEEKKYLSEVNEIVNNWSIASKKVGTLLDSNFEDTKSGTECIAQLAIMQIGCDSANNLKTPNKFIDFKESIETTTQYYTMFITFLEKAVQEGNTKDYVKSREYLNKANNSLKLLEQKLSESQSK